MRMSLQKAFNKFTQFARGAYCAVIVLTTLAVSESRWAMRPQNSSLLHLLKHPDLWYKWPWRFERTSSKSRGGVLPHLLYSVRIERCNKNAGDVLLGILVFMGRRPHERAQHLPILYRSFLYRRSEYQSNEALVNNLRQDITTFLFANLDFLQAFDNIKVYYDNGQQIVGKALRSAIEYVLTKNSYVYRKTKASDFMLEQAADLICTLELTAMKFDNKEASRTDERFFGGVRSFKKNYLKAIRRKRMK